MSEFLSLDGVMEEPMWTFNYFGEDQAKYKLDELMASDALLLGRVTYEGFATAWPDRKDEQGFADRMNSLPKYVVSTTLNEAEWNNSHVISANVAEEVTRLKQQPGQNILVGGSGQLVQSLMQHDLVDEYRIMFFPVVIGKGKRLFKQGSTATLKLTDAQTFASGVTVLTYQPDRKH
ncbi:dihydrofolate reductase family protein [Hymenobacter sp. GOD-10R]|uniref:dihydrofolate reductase family protein n=1 Tax=Hymenobacter sp. GOD-10R TaxID=3093922 RepID=UPI002D79625C|nr:dihydrofolate reductase family protein [Hymenobacter sp. GOD-10R]WRQ29292.1 dihydrofolate reductase family protein [Hymenobacter sp. GOD-10R]